MGEIAEMMLEGALCQVCGVYLSEGDGYPVSCNSCSGEQKNRTKERKQSNAHRMLPKTMAKLDQAIQSAEGVRHDL